MIDEKIRRINELSRKSREEGLTPQEEAEQKNLRNEYIKAYHSSLRSQLENTYVVGSDGVKRKLNKKA